MTVSKLWWRIVFTFAVVKILWQFKGMFISLGWRLSRTTKYQNLPPYQAALEEIGDWYSS